MQRHQPLVTDRRWPAAARHAFCSAAVLLAAALLIDWGSGRLTPLRAGLWVLLATVTFVVLLPARVVAGEGWLEVRGLWRRRRVATDALVSVRASGAVAIRLIMRDAHGGRLELDPRVLAANPLLWHRLDTDASHARKCGTLREGAEVLRELDERISGDQARALFTRSGL
ncbi:hypothetical protein LN042_03415 [Kitasatospora sp. RB6PN24]|uniref:hypothetical protein n=1 Tax=Kitasatospora humi TaxID=2893891 RepID=UPI001E418928|nr:hypothetical protein [Kitasatospora humi]MCC9306164.1 hypothetical protein [Kitasatospora humi]